MFSFVFLLGLAVPADGSSREGLHDFLCEFLSVSPRGGDGGGVDDQGLSSSSGGFLGVLPAVDGGYVECGGCLFEEFFGPYGGADAPLAYGVVEDQCSAPVLG